jgi:hypothetical protein
MKTLRIVGITLVLAAAAAAQTAISAKSGLINYLQGTALLDGAAVEVKPTRFVTVARGSELRTGDGLVEVLLGPGAVLRMGENSAFKMLSSDLADTRVELVAGSMIVERAEASKENFLTLVYKDSSIDLAKNGVYRVDSAPARLMVYDGEAKVHRDGQTQSVKKAKLLALEGVAVAEKFDTKNDDALFRWARRRAEYLAVANVSAARSMGQMGFSPTSSQGWVFNPFFGTFTYLPMNGVYDSFWGYRYWSMGAMYDPYYGGGYLRTSSGGRGSGSSSTATYTRVAPTSTQHSGVAAKVSTAPADSGAGRVVSAPREPVRTGIQRR